MLQFTKQTQNDKRHYVPKSKKIRETVKIEKKQNAEGHKMINNYVIAEYLGQGAFGKVKLVIKSENDIQKKYAMKIFKKSQLKRKREYIKDANGALKVKDALQDVKREIAIMKKISHPNLIQLFEVIDNPEKDKIMMILEFAEHGQLIEWDDEECQFFFCNEEQFEPFPETYLKDIFRDCIKGLHYLHANGIVHRDVKPQNILRCGQSIKIADFGVSLIVGENDLLDNTQGTFLFMPPEACNKDQVKKGYSGKAADIWSLGITFYAFTFLTVPFLGESIVEISEKIQEANLTFPETREVSDELKEFLRFMLEKDLSQRPTIEQLCANKWINHERKNLQEEMYFLNSIIMLDRDQLDIDLNQVSETEIQEAYSISTFILIVRALFQHWNRKIG